MDVRQLSAYNGNKLVTSIQLLSRQILSIVLHQFWFDDNKKKINRFSYWSSILIVQDIEKVKKELILRYEHDHYYVSLSLERWADTNTLSEKNPIKIRWILFQQNSKYGV